MLNNLSKLKYKKLCIYSNIFLQQTKANICLVISETASKLSVCPTSLIITNFDCVIFLCTSSANEGGN
jgi:hypothetical protein